MNTNYEDKRFANVEAEKQAELDKVNSTYNDMINQSDQYYQDQINAAKDYANTQTEIQNQNTDFAIEKIEQQKEQANKDYKKEQAGAYVDWQKQSNQYGVNAEAQATQGLNNTGYSESSQVSMYNQYQNRVATAREVYNKAVLNYDNSIKEAQLTNNSKLAEIAYQSLQAQLELSLQGFQYKNNLLQVQLEQEQATNDRYYSRWQDVQNQINTENQFAESVRQYEQNYAMQTKQFDEQVRQYEQNYQMQVKQFNESIRQFNVEIERLKAQDAADNAYKIQQLELQKRQLEESKRQANLDYSIKKAQLAAQKEQEEHIIKGGTADGTRPVSVAIGNQNYKLEALGKSAGNVYGKGATDSSGNDISTEPVMIAKGMYYVWNKTTGAYEPTGLPGIRSTR